MATIAVGGGAINAEGLGKPWLHMFRSGITVGGSVTQFSGGANMSVDVNVDATLGVFGAWINTSANVNYFGQSDQKLTPTVTTAHPTLARKDSVVAYIDLSLISTGTTNNAGAFKVITVPGTAAASPVIPNNTTIQTAVGAGNPFIIGPTIDVLAAATSITNARISGTWATSALRIPRIAGGSSNTLGHLVPNSADANFALTSQTSGKVDFAALLSTIFSGQVSTQANAGTAGGSMWYVNLGGIKLVWGQTAVQSAGNPNANYGVTFPTSFFTTIQAGTCTTLPATNVTNQYSVLSALNTVNAGIYMITPSTAATQSVFYLIIGT